MRRTIVDWLAHAAAAEDPATVEACVASAAAQAESCYDWRTLLRGAAELPQLSPELLATAAMSTIERAQEEREVWGFRDVATLRATRLDDVEGARAALEACLCAFAENPSTKGYEWVLLAEGFAETLSDRDGVRRCLETGRDRARARRSSADLCSIAVKWALALERADGAELLREAEELGREAADGVNNHRPWTFANAWRALDDDAQAERVLDEALAEASTVEAAVTVARAWSSHKRADRAALALERAQGLASTAADWLKIGEAALDGGLGEAAIRPALERAASLAVESDDRGRVSAGYRHWLNDDEAADRLGPRGLSPELLRTIVAPLPDWEASAAGLFDWLRGQITDEALARIADADYGMGAAKHLAALRDICSTGLIPRELGWEPHEVLALTRWSEGEGVDHLERALCCVLLCLAPDSMDELVVNGAILAESCLALGAAGTEHAQRFFAWYAGSLEPIELEDFDPLDDDSCERTTALLLLLILRVRSTPDDPRLTTLADRLTSPQSWGLELLARAMAESMRPKLWAALLERSLDEEHPVSARVLRALAGSDSD